MNLFARAFSDRRGHGVQAPQALGGPGAADATELAAAAGIDVVSARGVRPGPRARLGMAAHYGFSAALGVLYVAATRAGRPRPLRGLAFGTAVWLLADEGLVPVLGLSRGPRQIPWPVHLYAWAGHCVFGVAVDASRSALERRTGV